MDSKIALEKMKQLLCDISAKNESLNNDNNDLNIKIISLIKLLKSKDNQINMLNKSILKKSLKILFYKKNLAQKNFLKNAFNIFKSNIKNNNDINKKEKYFYSNENDIYIPGKNKLNYKETGIGDFKINQKFYVRKVSCLTLLKKRKNIINDEDNNGNTNVKYNYKFKNIEQQYEVNNICIKSNRNKTKEKPKYDYSVFNLEIKHKNETKIFDNLFILMKHEILYIKILENKCEENEIKYNKINKVKKELENELINIKQDLLISKNTMQEYINKYNNYKIMKVYSYYFIFEF